MVREESMDFGGNQILAQDLISDDLICKIKGLNPDLGTVNDPYYDRYAKYRDEIENAELIVIDANALNRSSVLSLELSNIDGISPLPSNYFQLMEDTLQINFQGEIDSMDYEENAMFEEAGLTEFGFSEFCDAEFSAYN